MATTNFQQAVPTVSVYAQAMVPGVFLVYWNDVRPHSSGLELIVITQHGDEMRLTTSMGRMQRALCPGDVVADFLRVLNDEDQPVGDEKVIW